MTDSSLVPGPGAAPKKSGCGRWALLLGLVVVGLALLAGLAVAGVVACAAMADGDSQQKNLQLREKTLLPGDRKRRVAVVSVRGVIDGVGGPLVGEGVAHQVSKRLRAACEDATVAAVVLAIDSPGGGLTASDVIYNEVLKLRAADKKVIAAVGDMAASGGYYVIAPADRIFVQPTGMVGSFGVIMEHFEVSELMKKIGVKVEPVKSTERKDIGSPFRAMTPEEKRFFEKILQSYHNRFVDIIAKGRKLERAKVAALATGEVYTAQEAQANGLADAIGYFDEALAYAREAAAAPKAQVFQYEDTVSFAKMMEAFSSQSGWRQLLGATVGPRLRAE